MLAFTKRNILLYFRDKAAIFFSLLSVLILLALYILFLADLTASGLPEFPSKKPLLISWFIAGVLAITSMTTTLGALGTFVEDKSNKRIMDFFASPLSTIKLLGGYIGSSFFVGIVMCLFVLLASCIYMYPTASFLPFSIITKVVAVIILSVFANGSMVLLLVSYFNTSKAFAAASMVIGTLLGFLGGIYIPIGALPHYLQTIIQVFPLSHSVALLRQLLMDPFLTDAFAQAPATLSKSFQLDMGVIYEMKGKTLSSLHSVFYLIATTALFFSLSLVNLKRKSR